MPRKQKKYHYLYKTTNLINNKFYCGMHSTDDLNDGYLGSGKRLRYSIAKYGKENFKIEYLEFFENRKTLVDKEKNLINEDFLKHPMCMNLMQGGNGGFISIEQQRNRSMAGGNAIRIKFLTDEEFRNTFKNNCSKSLKKSHILGKIKYDTFKGKHHNEETKKMMREKAEQRVGEKNSQFGTCWITNGLENKKIKKEDLISWLNIGWNKGRMIL